MEYQDASSRLVGSVEQKQTESMMNKVRIRGRIYYPNLDWEVCQGWAPKISPFILNKTITIFLSIFLIFQKIVNPKVYDWFMNKGIYMMKCLCKIFRNLQMTEKNKIMNL